MMAAPHPNQLTVLSTVLTLTFLFAVQGVGVPAAAAEGPDGLEEDPYFEAWLRGDDLALLELPPLDSLLPPRAEWDLGATLTTGVGYRDNVMLSAVNPRGGTFLLGGFELSFLRLPIGGTQFSLFLEGEHLQFVTGDDLPSDTFVSAYSQLSFPLANSCTFGVGLTAFYLDQMIDLATADLPLEPIRMQGYGITPNTFLRKEWANQVFVTTSLSASRQLFEEPLHEYWEYGPKIALGVSPSNREFTLSLEYLNRSYDDRRALSAEGAQLPGTQLAFGILRPEIEARVAWGKDHRWQSRSRLGLEFNRDNQTDYFAYDRIRVSQQWGFHHHGWDLQARFRYSFYDYKVQTIPNSSATRKRHSGGLGLEARRRLWSQLDLSVRYDLEKVVSNESETDYDVTTVTVGFGWIF
jgi:hypothetical protein